MTNKSGLGLGMVVASIPLAMMGSTLSGIISLVLLPIGLLIQLLEAIKE